MIPVVDSGCLNENEGGSTTKRIVQNSKSRTFWITDNLYYMRLSLYGIVGWLA